ncbi:hypothetical protein [Bradyrhizobium elkanii]|uniref:Uncharacterized protein n=1 Tax=Bradyrhizobium elkanii TaxID=29448 RepID=A0ABV4F0R6_BRAEL|nr:hypothetical protein [Bradyrhizobium elkanii]MCP1758041.1 hypothetical protein [Bradyrhizobium elkanii]MCP1983358.1 hypothetical protein [Bradyrhizobium elkanii]MCS3881662.1 hypothetical protein [Bradyrhizobium elkanii]MCS4218420.1 hypothetical protein [Bradyrhizobium elkanii]MCW2194284.1 hypothetical protein [Bradyrhizobium elkanii]
MKIQPWHRRHVIHVVSELPDDAEDALIVLRLATELVTDFLSSVVEQPAKTATVVLIGGNECA